ncbi:MAG: putative prolyl oligopeptidase family protein [Bradyrhizobium sp.]|nr:putative prolyl oligopeptidase family protein [Bradyrhizobium sp.]
MTARIQCVRLAISLALLAVSGAHAAAQRTVTVSDMIQTVDFTDGSGDLPGVSMVSPDGRLVAFVTRRADLSRGLLTYEVCLWRVADIVGELGRTPSGVVFAPFRVFAIRAEQSGTFTDLKWKDDSSGLYYLAAGGDDIRSLNFASVAERPAETISLPGQNVVRYDAHSDRVVYAVSQTQAAQSADPNGAFTVGTARSIYELAFPGGEFAKLSSTLGQLWMSVRGSKPRLVAPAPGASLHINRWGGQGTPFSLSPDGFHLVTDLPAHGLEPRWLTAAQSQRTAKADEPRRDGSSQFVIFDMRTLATQALLDAPDGTSTEAPAVLGAKWSPSGKEVALINTFVGEDLEQLRPGLAPCVAVVNVALRKATCLERLKATGDREYNIVEDADFDGPDTVIIHYGLSLPDGSAIRTYRRADGIWRAVASANRTQGDPSRVRLVVREGPNNPPKLIATDSVSNRSITLLDPNRSLRAMRLGSASLMNWTDTANRSWRGLLLTPPDYMPGKAYPLVIQAHGYRRNLSEFLASGSFTSSFAARPLAAAGMIVLQIDSDWESCEALTAGEVQCELDGYLGAIHELEGRHLIDENRIGIIGFSRTSLYTMAALTDQRFKIAAASVNDGVMESYLQYLLAVDLFDNIGIKTDNAVLGAPIGPGLEKWISRSPIFNLQRVNAPLRIEAVGQENVLFMWEPYAILRLLKKPVEFISLNRGTHPLSNPSQRYISQQGSVEWFRFWLQDYEDPDPAKQDQYKRWREMRRGN